MLPRRFIGSNMARMALLVLVVAMYDSHKRKTPAPATLQAVSRLERFCTDAQ